MQWRQPPKRVEHLRGDTVEFGRGRSRARGYLAHTERVGPGILLLESDGHGRADSFSAKGFTVLVPEVDLAVSDRAVEAAAEYLSANWHPRLGVVAVGPDGVAAARGLVDRGTTFDALVLYGGVWEGTIVASMPTLVHLASSSDARACERFALRAQESGKEVNVCGYEGNLVGPEAGLADARTLDMLEYLLS